MGILARLQQVARRIRGELKKREKTVLFFGVVVMIYLGKRQQRLPERLKLSYFLMLLSSNLVGEVMVSSNREVTFQSSKGDEWYRADASMLSKDQLYHLLAAKPDVVFDSVSAPQPAPPLSLPSILLNSLVFSLSGYISYQVVNKFLDNKDQPTVSQDPTQDFSDIYAMDDAKKELKEIIDYLKEPAKYQQIGARLRKGVLIHGPPGTGKTLLARATAGECKAHFIYSSASEFIEMYVGVGAKRIRNMFKQARENQPSIIFIDEIDGIGGKRSRDGHDQHDSERNNTLNQLLTEIDGFIENQYIVVMAATNRIQSLDDALVRSGRFDTKIQVYMPNVQERQGIINLHLAKKNSQVDPETVIEVGSQAKDFSGADLENLVNESAYVAIGQSRRQITNQDLKQAFNKIKSQKSYRRAN